MASATAPKTSMKSTIKKVAESMKQPTNLKKKVEDIKVKNPAPAKFAKKVAAAGKNVIALSKSYLSPAAALPVLPEGDDKAVSKPAKKAALAKKGVATSAKKTAAKKAPAKKAVKATAGVTQVKAGKKVVAKAPVASEKVAPHYLSVREAAALGTWAESGKPVGVRGAPPKHPYSAKITQLVRDNPKREGSFAWDQFELYSKHKTVGEFVAAGGKLPQLNLDEKKAFVKVGAK